MFLNASKVELISGFETPIQVTTSGGHDHNSLNPFSSVVVTKGHEHSSHLCGLRGYEVCSGAEPFRTQRFSRILYEQLPKTRYVAVIQTILSELSLILAIFQLMLPATVPRAAHRGNRSTYGLVANRYSECAVKLHCGLGKNCLCGAAEQKSVRAGVRLPLAG